MTETRKIEKAETRSQDGGLRFEFTRYADAGGKWVRHGAFKAFYADGTPASEGTYEDGLEQGAWRDFHDNGKVAAEGEYKGGKEHGTWTYYGADGTVEETISYEAGSEKGKRKPKAKVKKA